MESFNVVRESSAEQNASIDASTLFEAQSKRIDIAKDSGTNAGTGNSVVFRPTSLPDVTIYEPGPPGVPRSDIQVGEAERTLPHQMPPVLKNLDIPGLCMQDYKITLATFPYRDYCFMCGMTGVTRALPKDAVARPKYPAASD